MRSGERWLPRVVRLRVEVGAGPRAGARTRTGEVPAGATAAPSSGRRGPADPNYEQRLGLFSARRVSPSNPVGWIAGRLSRVASSPHKCWVSSA